MVHWIDSLTPADPAQGMAQEPKKPDVLEKGINTIERLERDIVPLDIALVLTSIAVSLRRIADYQQVAREQTTGIQAGIELNKIAKELNAIARHNIPNHPQVW